MLCIKCSVHVGISVFKKITSKMFPQRDNKFCETEGGGGEKGWREKEYKQKNEN